MSLGLLDLLKGCSLPRPDLGLLASTAVVFGANRLVPTYDHTWYKNLPKPQWTPKNWVFPAVWIPLKLMQSVALWAVWKSAKTPNDFIIPASLFGIHLFLGNWWNVVFFGRHQMQESLTWMSLLWLSIAGVTSSFYPINKTAAFLMVPTQIWVTIAAKLNYDIVQLNKAD